MLHLWVGSAVQMQDMRPTYVNAQKTPLYNSHHRIDGLPKKKKKKVNTPNYESTFPRSLRSSRFLSFSRRRSNKQAIKRASAWGEQKLREKWGLGEREGGGGGEERNRLQSIPNILPNSVRPRTGSDSAI